MYFSLQNFCKSYTHICHFYISINTYTFIYTHTHIYVHIHLYILHHVLISLYFEINLENPYILYKYIHI